MGQKDHDKRVDYIEFDASDIPAVKEFYTKVFDWTFTDYGPTYTSFHDGRLAGGFRQAGTVATGGPLVVLYATALEEARERVRSHGGQVVKDIFEFPGGRRFHFTDPAGNELAVWSDE